jgi:hypothetical protein
MKEMALTGTGTGETASSFKSFWEQDLVIGDRGSKNRKSLSHRT